MNTLNIIKNHIEKAARLHDAQVLHTAYRGVKYQAHQKNEATPHGTYTYRGRTYTSESWKHYKSLGSYP